MSEGLYLAPYLNRKYSTTNTERKVTIFMKPFCVRAMCADRAVVVLDVFMSLFCRYSLSLYARTWFADYQETTPVDFRNIIRIWEGELQTGTRHRCDPASTWS
jgi:hypothetical protein